MECDIEHFLSFDCSHALFSLIVLRRDMRCEV